MKLLALIKITWKEQKYTWYGITFFSLLVVLYALGQKTVDPKEKIQLFYTLSLETTSLLACITAIFSLSMTLPRDLQEKKVYLLLTTPLRPWELVLGRVAGAFFLGFSQLLVVVLFSFLLSLSGWVRAPFSTHSFIQPSGMEAKGSFSRNPAGIYWARRPQFQWKSHPSFSPVSVIFPFYLRSGVALLSPSYEALQPALVLKNFQILSSKTSICKGEILIDLIGPSQEHILSFQEAVEIPSQKEVIIPLPLQYLYLDARWEVTLFLENVDQKISLPLPQESLFLRVPFFFVQGDSQNFYRFLPLAPHPMVSRSIEIQESRISWHFHKLPSFSGRISFEWTPLLSLSHSLSHAKVAIGSSPDEIREIREIQIQDNHPVVLDFPSPGEGDIYFHLLWEDTRNPLGVDLKEDLTGRARNGVLLYLEEQSGWQNMASFLLLFGMKLFLIAALLGVSSIFLSRYLVLFLGLAFYLGGHSVPQMQEFSQMILKPVAHESHAFHEEGEEHSQEENLPPSQWAQSASWIFAQTARFFPNLSQYDSISQVVQGHSIPSSVLEKGLFYLFFHCLLFSGFALLLLHKREYL